MSKDIFDILVMIFRSSCKKKASTNGRGSNVQSRATIVFDTVELKNDFRTPARPNLLFSTLSKKYGFLVYSLSMSCLNRRNGMTDRKKIHTPT